MQALYEKTAQTSRTLATLQAEADTLDVALLQAQRQHEQVTFPPPAVFFPPSLYSLPLSAASGCRRSKLRASATVRPLRP